MSILLKSISNSDTTVMFSEDASFPITNGVILIGTEQITYSVNYMGTLYGCVRGANSTSAASHTQGVTISLINFYQAGSGSSGTFSSVTISGLTASQAVVTDGSKVLASSSTSATELGYVHGVTSAIQTQLDSKAGLNNTTFTGTTIIATLDIGDENFTYDQGNGVLLVGLGNWTSTNGFYINTDASNAGGPVLSLDPSTHTVNLGMAEINSGTSFTIDNNATSGQTPMLLWDITAGTMKRVSIGAADSGGTGFKVLRVPN